MSIISLSKEDAEKYIESSTEIADIHEFSKRDDCEIFASYYQGKDSTYLEKVTRKYSDLREEDVTGYFLYDSPYPVIYSLLHSCNHEHHLEAEKLYKNITGSKKEISVKIPIDISERINQLSDKYNCSPDLMIFNLIEQGVSSESELNDFYENYEKRTQTLSRENLGDLLTNGVIVASKEVL